ncbi:MAG: hypothetical protein WKF77_03030 [Planctomycetaceae bacterium]
MSSSTTKTNLQELNETSVTESFETPRFLFAQIVGDQAGLLEIGVHLPESSTSETVRSNLRLLIPGEVSPLEPATVDGKSGEFKVTFFSSEVSNSGNLPGEAELQFESVDGTTHFLPVQIKAMIEATHSTDDMTDNRPATPLIIYPKNVIVYSVIAIFFGLIIGFIFFATMN